MSIANGTCSRCRQSGEKLFLKGTKCRTAKCALEQNPITPGQHGRRIGSKKLSEYGKQLQEKQKVKIMYGLRERQFRRFFDIAIRQQGITGDNLLSLLERRIDNVVYRLRMSNSRAQSRQLIVHGHIIVNGKRVSSPSYIVRPNDIISLSESTMNNKSFVENFIDKRMGTGAKVPTWLELNKKDRKGIVQRFPERSDITAKIEEHLIVELYSK